ncbi:MAG: hypothetical protein GAK44_00036 [Pseudomonas delhiensis]|nr:MAG: hypothetical protein GAK44_00036 [Pseudomonas delhiensis]
MRRAVGGEALEVDPQLHGITARRGNIGLAQVEVGEAGAAGQAQLRLYQVEAGDGFGHGVLDLDARVGLHEKEVAAVLVEEEFEGAQAAVVHCARQAQRGVEHGAAQAWVEGRAGGDFQQFLMTSLQRTVTLPQVADLAAAIADHLHFDMPRAFDQALDIQVAVAKGGARFGLATGVGRRDLVGLAHGAHAPPATAGQGLDHHSGAAGQAAEEGLGLLQRGGLLGAAGQGQAVLGGQAARAGLVAEQGEGVRRRADE